MIASVPGICILALFSNLFKRIVNRFKKVGYNVYNMRQTACLVINVSVMML